MSRLVVIPVVALLGCLDVAAPEVGAPLREPCVDADSDPATAISYRRDIEAALFRDAYHCVDCHTATGPTPLGLLVGGLDLGSYDGLRRGGAQSGADIVVVGRPCRSVLVRKLGAGPPFGARMPLDGPPYLDSADLRIISDWIAEGAHAD